nr:hypothetical protein BaRGS_000026 [Batillaria attramentaria]
MHTCRKDALHMLSYDKKWTMAEARSASHVGLEPQFHTKQDEAEIGSSLWQETYILWMRAVKRRYYRTRNLIRNGVWPTSLWNLGVSVLLLTCVQFFTIPYFGLVSAALNWVEHLLPLPAVTPEIVREVLTSFICGLVFFILLMYFRRYLLRVLLAYRGWMYEPPRKQSALTLAWGALVRLVTGSHPTLYSYQRSLPRMSVPPLKETINKLLTSLAPLYKDKKEEFAQLKREAIEFERTLGPTLQKALIIKSWLAPNFVSDWWEKYVYLMGRSPLPINSNYYIMDQCYWSPTTSQTNRAASVLYQFLVVKQMIDRQSLEPLVIRHTIPVCMAQYERIFSTTRVPGEETDVLVHYDLADSQHVAVYRKGVLYMMKVYDQHRKLLAPQVLEKQLQWIIEDAEKYQEEYTEGQMSLPALTTMERTAWWKIRNEHFSTGINRESLHHVESAILFLNLDAHSFPFEDLSKRASYLLHGDGRSVWFDKSVNILAFEDGKMGLNCEHSLADAPVIAHAIEYNLTEEVRVPLHDENGKLIPVTNASTQYQQPMRLVFDVDSALEAHVTRALSVHQQNIEDLDLELCDHRDFGKGFIKTCKVSPDAFIQMALQVTYLKNAGKLALTYEAAMTRLYLQGRTETVRSLTSHAAAFAHAFVDPSVSVDEKKRLLTAACEHHQVMYKDAMNGKLIDRHLFALYVASRGLGYECEFLKKVLSIPWTLSTSQQPQQQIAWAPDCSQPQYANMPATSSKLFMSQLFDTMREMQELFKDGNKKQESSG